MVKVLNTTAGSLLLFKIMLSFTKSQQVDLTDGEERVWVFSAVMQRQESLWCCSGGCATVAAPAKRVKTAAAGLADRCADLIFLLGKSLLSHS